MPIDLAQIKERNKLDDMMTLRIIAICLASLLPGFYYIFSTSIIRACMFLSITISIYLLLEFLYFSNFRTYLIVDLLW